MRVPGCISGVERARQLPTCKRPVRSVSLQATSALSAHTVHAPAADTLTVPPKTCHRLCGTWGAPAASRAAPDQAPGHRAARARPAPPAARAGPARAPRPARAPPPARAAPPSRTGPPAGHLPARTSATVSTACHGKEGLMAVRWQGRRRSAQGLHDLTGARHFASSSPAICSNVLPPTADQSDNSRLAC